MVLLLIAGVLAGSCAWAGAACQKCEGVCNARARARWASRLARYAVLHAVGRSIQHRGGCRPRALQTTAARVPCRQAQSLGIQVTEVRERIRAGPGSRPGYGGGIGCERRRRQRCQGALASVPRA